MIRYRRLIVAFAILVGVNLSLAFGYWLMNRDRLNPDGTEVDYLQCLYMTVVSTFTVGYGELVPIETAADQIYTMFVIVLGLGTMGYGLSQMTAFIVEGDLKDIIERRKMEKQIAALRDHFIVCGAGDVGHYVMGELAATQRAFVAVDTDEAHLKKLAAHQPFPYVVGDATDEAVLTQAGIKAAAGVVCALSHDRDNLVLAMTCRQINPQLRIVAMTHDIKLSQRIKSAGADAVVSPQFIGGMRLVSEMVRPTVVSFLDLMLRDQHKSMRVEEVLVAAGSALDGATPQSPIVARSEVLIMAFQAKGSSAFQYVPASDVVFHPGSTLIVLGEAQAVAQLREAGLAGKA